MLVRGGVRTVQTIGVPLQDSVIEADAQSLRALEWLKFQGCEQFFFKYCSTFDSTGQGNIGPVVDALLDALDENFAIVCPASRIDAIGAFPVVIAIAGMARFNV